MRLYKKSKLSQGVVPKKMFLYYKAAIFKRRKAFCI